MPVLLALQVRLAMPAAMVGPDPLVTSMIRLMQVQAAAAAAVPVPPLAQPAEMPRATLLPPTIVPCQEA